MALHASVLQVQQSIHRYLFGPPPPSSPSLSNSTPPCDDASSSATLTQTLVEQLEQYILKQELAFSSLIKALGPGLTCEQDSTRAKANALLSQLCLRLNQSSPPLEKHTVQTLVAFFCEKLTDSPAIVAEAIVALCSLAKSVTFTSQEGIGTVQALFANLPARNLSQPVRLSALTLLDAIMAYHRDGLKQMGNQFISGYCSLIEGEKDPRNLIVIFSLTKVVLMEFDLKDKLEEIFDVTFCYFPITFTPPPGDPDAYGGITPEELTDDLIECLSATPSFGILALPLLLDKFHSPSLAAKEQVLKAVVKAFPVFGQRTVTEFASVFWESFCLEIIQLAGSSSKDRLSSQLAEACQVLLRTLFPPDASNYPSGPADFIQGVLDPIIDVLQSPEKSKAISAIQLVCWMLESGANLADVIKPVLHRSTELLIQHWKVNGHSDEVAGRRNSVVGHISTILDSLASAKFAASVSAAPIGLLSPALKDEILNLLITVASKEYTASHSFAQGTSMKALAKLPHIPQLLSSEELTCIATTLTKCFVVAADEECRDAALHALCNLSDGYPSLILSATLPELFQRIPDVQTYLMSPSNSSPSYYINFLEALVALCDRDAFFGFFVTHLLDKVNQICRGDFQCVSAQGDCGNTGFDVHMYCHHLISALYLVLKKKIDSTSGSGKALQTGNDEVLKHADDILHSIFQNFTISRPTKAPASPPTGLPGQEGAFGDALSELPPIERYPKQVLDDVGLMLEASQLMSLLVGQLTSARQQQLLIKLHTAYQLGDARHLVEDAQPEASPIKLPTKGDCDPDGLETVHENSAHKNILIFYLVASISLRPEVGISEEVLSTTMSLPFQYLKAVLARGAGVDTTIVAVSLRFLCSRVNKRAADYPHFFAEELSAYWDSQINVGSSCPLQARRLAVEIWLWITKGLVVRCDERAYSFLDRMCSLLQDSDLGSWVAKRFGGLVDEEDETLNHCNFAVVGILWKQRVCHYLGAKLVPCIWKEEGARRAVYLMALCSLLVRVDPSVISVELPQLIPIMLDAAMLPDIHVKVDALKILYELLMAGRMKEFSQANLLSLIQVLLHNCVSRGAAPSCEPETGGDGTERSEDAEAATATRMWALRMLGCLPSWGSAGACHGAEAARGTLLGQRSEVLRGCVRALDDARVGCRALAVECRAEWFGMDV